MLHIDMLSVGQTHPSLDGVLNDTQFKSRVANLQVVAEVLLLLQQLPGNRGQFT